MNRPVFNELGEKRRSSTTLTVAVVVPVSVALPPIAVFVAVETVGVIVYVPAVEFEKVCSVLAACRAVGERTASLSRRTPSSPMRRGRRR